MRVLVLTDIFGVTPELVTLAGRFTASPILLSPYREQHDCFSDEQDAYRSFQHNGGLEAYLERINPVLQREKVDACVGFSAGATAAWRAACDENSNLPPAILFYGSRIRDYACLRPHSPVELIFAEEEAHFSVAPLAACLADAGCPVSVWPGTKHGFMNMRSSGFDAQAMEAGLRAVTLFLARACSPHAGHARRESI
jgi:dienelactone hydrolase